MYGHGPRSTQNDDVSLEVVVEKLSHSYSTTNSQQIAETQEMTSQSSKSRSVSRTAVQWKCCIIAFRSRDTKHTVIRRDIGRV